MNYFEQFQARHIRQIELGYQKRWLLALKCHYRLPGGRERLNRVRRAQGTLESLGIGRIGIDDHDRDRLRLGESPCERLEESEVALR